MVGKKVLKSKSRPILKKILIPMCILILVEVILLGGTIVLGGVFSELNQNARDILEGKVVNRKSYIENEMINNWSNVSDTAEKINKKAEELQAAGLIDIHAIDTNSTVGTPLLQEISGDLIAMMRTNRVTGVFVVFMNDSLDELEAETGENKPGIYLRDTDPLAGASKQNGDLLIERSPVEMISTLDIATDTSWKPTFGSACSFIIEPYRQGMLHTSVGSGRELGYWSEPYSIKENNDPAISYSIPLIAADGTVYAVMGVDLTLDYLGSLLPEKELMDDGKGSYLLGIKAGEKDVLQTVLVSGTALSGEHKSTTWTKTENGGYTFQDKKSGKVYYGVMDMLELYDNNAPFENQKWMLVGMTEEKELHAFVDRMGNSISLAIGLMVILGICGSFLISIMISKPVRLLVRDMYKKDSKSRIVLQRTNIEEIDRLEMAIEKLSGDLLDSATKFSQILKYASVRIGGFEIDEEKNTLFITDGFFDIFREEEIDTKSLTPETLQDTLDALSVYRFENSSKGYMLYKLPQGGDFVYVKLSYSRQNTRFIGVAEDVTASEKRRKEIEYERDHDSMTGLKNRRAFRRKVEVLFAQGEQVLKKAALVMIDLDNLKMMNDSYGHDYGDQYIKCAAKSFQKYTPDKTEVARISGDEFYIFFYGYDSEDEIREALQILWQGIDGEQILLPTSEPFNIRVSGGVAWYPRDTKQYTELKHFADFAMYQVKHAVKGELKSFDISLYQSEEVQNSRKKKLMELLTGYEVEYFFQPIVEVSTGEIFAYEALMRGKTPEFRSPHEIISLAAAEHKLELVEEMTWMKAPEAFANYVHNGKIGSTCKVFINSLADQSLPPEMVGKIEKKHSEFLSRIVIELTEEEMQREEALTYKRECMKRWGSEIALDDFGTGYNGEGMLLSLQPRYLKIAREMIQNIHLEENKQNMLRHVISYAHAQNILVISEGVEKEEEVEAVIRLGTDFIQGFYVAYPELEPPVIEAEMAQRIRTWNEESKNAKERTGGK